MKNILNSIIKDEIKVTMDTQFYKYYYKKLKDLNDEINRRTKYYEKYIKVYNKR